MAGTRSGGPSVCLSVRLSCSLACFVRLNAAAPRTRTDGRLRSGRLQQRERDSGTQPPALVRHACAAGVASAAGSVFLRLRLHRACPTPPVGDGTYFACLGLCQRSTKRPPPSLSCTRVCRTEDTPDSKGDDEPAVVIDIGGWGCEGVGRWSVGRARANSLPLRRRPSGRGHHSSGRDAFGTVRLRGAAPAAT